MVRARDAGPRGYPSGPRAAKGRRKVPPGRTPPEPRRDEHRMVTFWIVPHPWVSGPVPTNLCPPSNVFLELELRFGVGSPEKAGATAAAQRRALRIATQLFRYCNVLQQ